MWKWFQCNCFWLGPRFLADLRREWNSEIYPRTPWIPSHFFPELEVLTHFLFCVCLKSVFRWVLDWVLFHGGRTSWLSNLQDFSFKIVFPNAFSNCRKTPRPKLPGEPVGVKATKARMSVSTIVSEKHQLEGIHNHSHWEKGKRKMRCAVTKNGIDPFYSMGIQQNS